MRVFWNIRDLFEFVPDGEHRHALRNFNFMNKSQPASVADLATELGFSVERRDLPWHRSGLLEPDSWAENGFRVVANVNHSVFRQRFTVLHEIGHFFLHAPDDTSLMPSHNRATGLRIDDVYSENEMVEEREANAFADALVFGDRALEGAIGLWGKDLAKLERHFGFSSQVVARAIAKRRL